jgi:hypothetical protein
MRIAPLEAAHAFAQRRPRAFLGFALLALIAVGLIAYSAYVGASPVVYRDGLFYLSMRQDSPWLPRSVRLALSTPAPEGEPGEVSWRRLRPGLEIGELPVLVDGEEVERLYLTRLDPALYEFRIRIDADNDLNGWMRDLRPAAVINASYYNAQLGPATPVLIDGERAGPSEYDARHGVFVSSAQATHIVDLAAAHWRDAMGDADTAMVSYPLLLTPDGENRAPESRWLASRSFIAEDANGLVVLGSAPEGFFSLHRLGEFLRRTPLHLRYVLNLDGGPVACHGVSAGGVTRLIYGQVELQSDGEGMPLRVLPSSRDIHALMPIVLAAFPREAATAE